MRVLVLLFVLVASCTPSAREECRHGVLYLITPKGGIVLAANADGHPISCEEAERP